MWPFTKFTVVHYICPKRMSYKVTAAKITFLSPLQSITGQGLKEGLNFFFLDRGRDPVMRHRPVNGKLTFHDSKIK